MEMKGEHQPPNTLAIGQLSLFANTNLIPPDLFAVLVESKGGKITIPIGEAIPITLCRPGADHRAILRQSYSVHRIIRSRTCAILATSKRWKKGMAPRRFSMGTFSAREGAGKRLTRQRTCVLLRWTSHVRWLTCLNQALCTARTKTDVCHKAM